MKESEKTKRLRNRLEMYYQAEEAILSGAQSYQIGSRNLTRANLDTIRKMIDELENALEEQIAIDKGKRRNKVLGAIPRDI